MFSNSIIKYVVLVSIVITVCLMTYMQSDMLIQNNIEQKISVLERNIDQGLFTINTPGCKIPYLQAYDKIILDYILQPERIVCNNGVPALFKQEKSYVRIIPESLSSYHVTDLNNLTCCYKAFWREDPNDLQVDNKIRYQEDCHIFVNKTEIKQEFVTVICTYNNSDIYTDMFAFVQTKNLSKKINKGLKKHEPIVNVLIIGLDAISRLNFYRQMPKTLNYLKQIGAVEMKGYNKVGDNTFPNLIPALTGKHVEEIRKECWPTDDHHFDNCSFIWKRYKENGYVTAFGEDSSWMGTFYYLKKGFKKQPTDYSYNYFNAEAERVIGNYKYQNVKLCQGSRWVYQDHIRYLSDFVHKMTKNSLKYFGFFWQNSISHDDLNLPRIGDDNYYLLFKKLKMDGCLNDTVLFVVSDHGIRWGNIRSTFQGMMEERLPFLYVYLPEWYREKYENLYNNLQKNSLRLTTPFDLHETLVHLLNESDTKRHNDDNNRHRGISLLRQISDYRTCEDTDIESHWCTCQKSTELDVHNSITETVVNFAVSYINSLLSAYSQCSHLNLSSVLNARIMKHSENITGNYRVADYMMSFSTVPGNGIFEATVRYMSNVNSYDIVGSISRLNLYGNQSACVSDDQLKLYCFCK